MLNDLELQKSKLELERGNKPTKKDLLEYIKVIINGDKQDMGFQKTLIDNLVYNVIVSDGSTLILLNIDEDKNIEYLSKEEIVKIGNKLKNGETFRMQSAPSRQVGLI